MRLFAAVRVLLALLCVAFIVVLFVDPLLHLLSIKWFQRPSSGRSFEPVQLAHGVSLSRIGRDGAIREIRASSIASAAYGLGWAHAEDRSSQLLMWRSVGRGRLSEVVAGSGDAADVERAWRVDCLARELKFHMVPQKELSLLDRSQGIDLYLDGINSYFSADFDRLPFELRLLSTWGGANSTFLLEPFTVEDILSIQRLTMYLGLADTQQVAEKTMIIKLLHDLQENGLEFAKHLFGETHFRGFDSAAMLPIFKELHVFPQATIPVELKFGSGLRTAGLQLPKVSASNNWVVSRNKTASKSGGALMASDPHLHVLSLPGMWYEVLLRVDGRSLFGTTIAGTGFGLLFGRTTELSWSFTYGFHDHIDFFLIRCRGLTCQMDGKWLPMQTRQEQFRLGTGESRTVTFLSTPVQGYTIELPYSDASAMAMFDKGLSEGYYVARGYAHELRPGVRNLMNIAQMMKDGPKTVGKAREYVRTMEVAANFLLADSEGSIAYQQTGGGIPVRNTALNCQSPTGLLPIVGWLSECAWNGWVNESTLLFIENPSEGFLVSANGPHFFGAEIQNGIASSNTQNQVGVSLHMGSDRVFAIEKQLSDAISRGGVSVDDLKRIQADVHSLKAEQFMQVLLPLLAQVNSSAADALKMWDCRFNVGSYGAVLFDRWYDAVLDLAFGPILGPDAWVKSKILVMTAFFHYFDNLLLNPSDSWLYRRLTQTKDELFLAAALQSLSGNIEPIAYGDAKSGRQVQMQNAFFQGKLGRLGIMLGLDGEPFGFPGSSTTINQGQLFSSELLGRQSFAPSLRFVTDMGSNLFETAVPTGPSDRPWSGLYWTGHELWRNNLYKQMHL